MKERLSRKAERQGRKEEKEKGRQEGKRREGSEEGKKLTDGPEHSSKGKPLCANWNQLMVNLILTF